MRSRVSSSIARFTAFIALASGCAAHEPPVKAALNGTLADLEREIARREAQGPMPKAELVRLSRAVAAREVSSSRGREGARRLATLRGCAAALEPELQARAERANDEPAATASLLLFERGNPDPKLPAERYAKAEDAAFRALAARASIGERYAEQRRRFFTDPDERVRAAAFTAALEGASEQELPDLLEAARLDPNAQNRARAARAAGRKGGERAVLGLVDVFAAAGSDDRQSVLEAFAERASFGSGGERELARALSLPGLSGVSAAGLLLQSLNFRLAAIAVLARAIESGSDDERSVALAVAPAREPQVERALLSASKSAPPALRARVLARLHELPAQAQQALRDLEALARDPSDAGLEAAYALAPLGSLRAIARIEKQLGDPDPAHRLRASLVLARRGKLAHLAARLADPNPEVRAQLSCALLGS